MKIEEIKKYMEEENKQKIKLLDRGSIELIDHMGSDNTVVASARVSYLGKSKGVQQDSQLIKYLMDNKHTSPFEQVEFQFLVKCPVFVARQWHRHRTWSYNEVSRRYTSDDIDFYVPANLRRQSSDNKQMSDGVLNNADDLIEDIYQHSKKALELYTIMVARGVSREQARMVLPHNLYTSFYAKTDLHNLLHFIELRNHEHAQMEIRVYAQAIEKLIAPIVPISYKAWKEKNVL